MSDTIVSALITAISAVVAAALPLWSRLRSAERELGQARGRMAWLRGELDSLDDRVCRLERDITDKAVPQKEKARSSPPNPGPPSNHLAELSTRFARAGATAAKVRETTKVLKEEGFQVSGYPGGDDNQSRPRARAAQQPIHNGQELAPGPIPRKRRRYRYNGKLLLDGDLQALRSVRPRGALLVLLLVQCAAAAALWGLNGGVLVLVPVVFAGVSWFLLWTHR